MSNVAIETIQEVDTNLTALRAVRITHPKDKAVCNRNIEYLEEFRREILECLAGKKIK